MASGLVLVLLGVWLIGQALAGSLAARIIAAARTGPDSPGLASLFRPGGEVPR